MQGSADHPELPRVTGSNIVGYEHVEYGAGRFASSFVGKEFEISAPEGKTTRIIYVGRETQSSLQLFRNFETAFGRMGEFTEIYSCKSAECVKSRIGSAIVWSSGHKIPNVLSGTYGFVAPSTYKEPMYVYGTVQKGDATYHVSVFTATVLSSTPKQIENRPVAHVEIVEVEDFEPTLETVDADAVSNQLETKGRIALYGILFDFDSAVLQASSASTVAEVAKSLKDNPSMSVYVVGHTDNAGDYTYNRDLSQQRAASVVQVLVDKHGISSDRLLAVGVGPVAPKANNDSEDGRRVNRRVEIVRR
jgi:outer membrane protein OmpA-like peptidoglycan-associated protein